jgi:UDP-glucose 4-epimerase
MKVLVTGAAGYIGKQLVHYLTEKPNYEIVACDIRDENPFKGLENVVYMKMDIRSQDVLQALQEHPVNVVVHLASIVTPGKKSNRAFEYSVDVDGTRNILEACVQTDVKRIIISSSGAAYGYHPENVKWLTEEDPIRGNEEFAYSYHKRLVEEMLADYRLQYPQLEQTIFRIGTILGKTVSNQITNLFDQRFLFGIRGSDSPFVFIWDQDVVRCFAKAIDSEKTGIYNLAGDGALSIDELAILMAKKVVKMPGSLVACGLFVLKRLNLTQYGEEQVRFLRYRPVLSNEKLKADFNFIPEKTSLEVFEYYFMNKKINEIKQMNKEVPQG